MFYPSMSVWYHFTGSGGVEGLADLESAAPDSQRLQLCYYAK